MDTTLPLGKEPFTRADKVNPTVKKLRVIIMDDEKMIREITEIMFKHLGHEVFLAKNGEETLKIYKKAMENNTPIDLTIMDLSIPKGMGGKEAVQKLLKIDPKAKVVVFSGHSNDPIMVNCKAYGFCAAIAKPSKLEDFTNIINRLEYKNSN